MKSRPPVVESATEGLGVVPEAAPPERPRTAGGSRSDVLKLVSGATLAQLTSVIAAPILSRLYDPEALGLSTLFNSIAGIVAVVVCLRYELSIVLPERDEEAAHLLGASLLFTVVTSVLMVPAVLFGGKELARLVKAPELGDVLWLMPLMVFVTGVSLALTYWNSRTRRFGRVSVAKVSSSATTSAAQVAAGLAGRPTGSSLVGATVLGTALGTALLAGQTLRDDHRVLRDLRWSALRDSVTRYRKFLFFGTGSALLNAISWQLPAFLLQGYFSAAVVGFYALGNRVLRMPMSLIGSAIGQVFYQRSAEASRNGTLAKTVEGAFERLVVLSLLPLTILTIIGREAFGLVFGSRWVEAGYYAELLGPWTFFWFISSPLSTLFAVLERQEFGLKMNTLIFVSRLLSLVIGGSLHDARLAVLLFSASGVVVYGYYTFAILKASEVDVSKSARFLLARIIEYLPAIAILIALKVLGAPDWILVGVATALLAVYGIRAVRRDPALTTLWRGASAR